MLAKLCGNVGRANKLGVISDFRILTHILLMLNIPQIWRRGFISIQLRHFSLNPFILLERTRGAYRKSDEKIRHERGKASVTVVGELLMEQKTF